MPTDIAKRKMREADVEMDNLAKTVQKKIEDANAVYEPTSPRSPQPMSPREYEPTSPREPTPEGRPYIAPGRALGTFAQECERQAAQDMYPFSTRFQQDKPITKRLAVDNAAPKRLREYSPTAP